MTSKYQKSSYLKWRKKNPLKARRASYRSSMYTFIRHYSTPNDLIRVVQMANKYKPKAIERVKKNIVKS